MQAAVGCKLALDERYAKSPKSYQETEANSLFKQVLQEICGANCDDGEFPFPTKQRPPRDGGPWTMKQRCSARAFVHVFQVLG